MLICFLEGPLSQTCLKSVEKLDSGNAFAGEVRGPHAPGEAERRGGLAPHSERLMPADGEVPLNPDRNGFPGSDMRFRRGEDVRTIPRYREFSFSYLLILERIFRFRHENVSHVYLIRFVLRCFDDVGNQET